MRLLVLVSVVLVSCEKNDPPPELSLTLRGPLQSGFAMIAAAVDPPTESMMTLRVTQGAAPVIERTFERGLGEALLMFQPDAGDYRATMEVDRSGSIVARAVMDLRVFPSLPMTTRIHAMCSRLALLNVEGTEFDCDGVAIDATGASLPGRLAGETRIARSAAGLVRWVLFDGVLMAETPGGVSNGVAFPTGHDWAASTDFAVSGATLAMLNGQTLELVEWDAGMFATPSTGSTPPRWVPLMGVSKEGRRGIMFGAGLPWDSLGFSSPHAFCLLEFDARWRLTACPLLQGIFVREELDGRALFQSAGQLWLVDLLAADTPELARPLESGEGYREGSALTRAAPWDPVFGVPEDWPPTFLPDGGVRFNDDFSVLGATADIVWARALSDTVWAPLP